MIRDPPFHRGRNSQRLVNPAEVVERVPERNRGQVVLSFFAERIRPPGTAGLSRPNRFRIPLRP